MRMLDTKQLKRLSTKRLRSLKRKVKEVRFGERKHWEYYLNFLRSMNASQERIDMCVRDYQAIVNYYVSVKSVLDGREQQQQGKAA
jgi:hypothetical protein